MTALHRAQFARVPRAEFAKTTRALEDQRDRALAQSRATLEFVLTWLHRRAEGYVRDAEFLERPVRPDNEIKQGPLSATQRRMIADELRTCALDVEHARRGWDPIVESLSVLSVQPGDTLIVRLPRVPTLQETDVMARQVRTQLPAGVEVLVVGPGVTFETVRPAR